MKEIYCYFYVLTYFKLAFSWF